MTNIFLGIDEADEKAADCIENPNTFCGFWSITHVDELPETVVLSCGSNNCRLENQMAAHAILACIPQVSIDVPIGQGVI